MKSIKITFFLILIFSMNSLLSFGQCENNNGGFEVQESPIYTPYHNWLNYNVPNWFVSHGNPMPVAANNPFGTKIKLQNISSGGGDGIYTNYTFVPGKTYNVTFELFRDGTSPINSELQVKLANGLQNGGGNNSIPIINSAQHINSINWSTNGITMIMTETFVVNSPGFDFLWLYPEAQGRGTVSCTVDNICITEVKECKNENGDLANQTSPVPSPVTNAWINSSLDNWNVSHGQPDYVSGSGFNIGTRSFSTLLESGVYTNFPFVSGNTYRVYYDLVISDPNGEIQIELTNSLTQTTNSNSTNPLPNPSFGVDIKSGYIFPSQTYYSDFTVPLGTNYNQLWFYGSQNISVEYKGFVNNICIKEITCGFTPQMTNNASSTAIDDCSINFINSTQLLGNMADYQILNTIWDFGDGSTSSGNDVYHHYTSAGTYNVCMTTWVADGENCCTKEICETIVVNDPVCEIDPCSKLEKVYISDDGNNPRRFTARGIPAILNNVYGYYWEFYDGNWSYGSGKVIDHAFDPNNSGWFFVRLTVIYYDEETGSCCSHTLDDYSFQEDREPKWKTKNDSDDETEDGNLEGNIGLTNMLVYPNPSNGLIDLKMENGDEIHSLNVFDLSGRSVYRMDKICSGRLCTIDLTFLNKGMYIIVVNESNSETRQFERIIIE